MKRPNPALTGIDKKLSADITWALNVTERSHLDAVRHSAGAAGVRNLMLALAAVVFAIGVQAPGLTWLWATIAAAAVAVLGVIAHRLLSRRGEKARVYLNDLVLRQYHANLLHVREHDVVVEAGYPVGGRHLA